MSGRVGPLKPLTPPFINTYSLDFDGIDDYVSMGNVLNLANDGSDAISISLWLKTTLSSLGYLVSKQTAFTDGYGVFMLPTGEIAFYLGSSTSSARIYAYTQNTFNDGDWHNVITTYDGSQDVSGLNIYVNDTSQALTVVTNNTPNNVSNIANFAIGMRNGNAYPYLDYIDEVSVFNSELTSENVTAIYNGGTPTDLTDLSPVAWYRMGDNGSYKSPQWLIPNNENKDKVSNYSFEFDGVDDYISVTPNPLTDFTVSFWIKPKSGVGASYDGILGQGTTSPQGGILRYVAYDGTASIGSVLVFLSSWTNVSGTVTNGVWTNIVLTYDSVTDELKGYNNGSLYTTISNPDFSAQTTNAHSFERIGLRNGLNGTEFNGSIDEVALWDSALTDISSIYNGGTPTTLPSGAVAHWRMGEEATFSGGVWTVPDSVGSNNGTSNAMTIEDRVGSAPSSSNNAVSFNMDLIDRVEDTPPNP